MNAIDIKAGNPPIAATAEERASAYRWAMAALGCLGFAFWMLIHPYRGLEHDSTLYTVLALARLHPASFGHDLFVRYGNQDHYTLFTPLYAAAIRALGLERGAALLTFITHAAFFGSAWVLARRLMGPSEALLAVGLLVVLPSWYGSDSVFAYVEGFLTPRQSAEAFALAGIAAVLYARPKLAALCMIVALVLHPIIAAAGITLWMVLVPGLARPRLMAGVISALGVLLVCASLTGFGPFAHFDGVWFDILKSRLAYLFPTIWKSSEWLSEGIHAAVLVVGARYCRADTVRRLCLAALITVALGMVFAIVETDWLHVIIPGQMQTWRWLWLLGVVSVLLAPVIAIDCWRAGSLAQAAALLLLCAWLTRSDGFASIPLGLACLAAVAPVAPRNPRALLYIRIGTYVLLAISVAIVAGEVRNSLPQLGFIRAQHRAYLVRIGELQALAFGGLLPAALLALTWWSTRHATRRTAVLLAAFAAALMVSVMPYSLMTWLHERYPDAKYQAFAPWRAAIPESADVLWPDTPPVAWFELGRASYWSFYQMAGLVFSRDVTMVSTQREIAVGPVMPQLGRVLSYDKHYGPLDPQKKTAPVGTTGPCDLPGVTFYASWLKQGPTPYPVIVPDVDNPAQSIYLYRCGNDRS